MVSTKVEIGFNHVARARDLDELAALLFPGNKNHQRIFLAIFVELKWAENQFLPSLEPIARRHGLSCRVLETVRAKMRRLGLVDHVSRFNKKYAYQEGWILSHRFEQSLGSLASMIASVKKCRGNTQKEKDSQAWRFL